MIDDKDDWVVFSYSRKQALEDGVLIEIENELVKNAGIKIPVAVTSALYEGYLKSSLPGQDLKGRIFDMLILLNISARGVNTDTIYFDVLFQMEEDKTEPIKLKAVIGPDDDFSACLTVMMPEED